MDCRSHWNKIFSTKLTSDVSWYQPHLQLSLQLISNTASGRDAKIIDVGGGDSSLVDDLIQHRYANLTILDISSQAIKRAKERLKDAGSVVQWIETDILQAQLRRSYFDVWHDRAMFHFLVDTNDKNKYLDIAADSIKPNGQLIVGSFAPDGPQQCSGLPTIRYSQEALAEHLKSHFEFVESLWEDHVTPQGKKQQFIYCRFVRKGSPVLTTL